ncbi:hypothetical protein J2D78_09815 [Microbacterium maritypicum]|uniref:hypothetical protein n=1 Tax=Microbacterium maritypicum TaxID=33918 RepID=UPI001B32CF85|nr:hypothetical protein [Microbacterium liquefaciens]MBP5802378.1 hypothetical protein [Microbacterium liquefaciens]
MNTQHPRREQFATDVDFWAACIEHLEALHPEGAEIRRALWRSIEAQNNTGATIARLRELITLDRPFTDAESAEWDALATEYRSIRRAGERAKR